MNEKGKPTMMSAELQKKLEALKQTIEMFIETEAVRAKYGHATDDDASQEMSLLRIHLHNLEKEVYGSSLAAMKARIAHLRDRLAE
jgi:hypothetical protein